MLCCYCDRPLRLHVNAPATPAAAVAATLDHVTPRELGGDNSPANVVAACSDCNERKGLRTPAEWAAEDDSAPADAAARAARETASRPTERALRVVREAWGLPPDPEVDARGRARAWSSPECSWRG